MTYDQDPARWSTDPDEAPELLRGAFSAGRNEGPSRNQMRSLAVKLAAASAGGAVAVGTVKAASAGNTLTTVATWSAAKVASVIVLAGSVVTSAVIWRNSSPDAPSERTRAPMQAPVRSTDLSTDQPTDEVSLPQAVESAQQQPGSPAVVAPSAASSAPSSTGQAAAPGVVVTPVGAEPTPTAAPAVSVEALPQARSAQQSSVAGSRGVAQTTTARNATPAASSTARSAAQRKPANAVNDSARSSSSARTARVATTSSAELPPPSEVTLLRNAQVALQSRPREAFQLTQQHRRLYPAGEFAQERDALAIQALMRAGETDQARELAQAFIRAYPTSPHAHRFREAMGIH